MVTAPTASRHCEGELRSISEAIRAAALFASALQPSQAPPAGQVHSAVTEKLRSLGALGCAALLASEFGDPRTARGTKAGHWRGDGLGAYARRMGQPLLRCRWRLGGGPRRVRAGRHVVK